MNESQSVSLLDKIILNDDSSLLGVVDYIDNKHVYFINFNNIQDENLIVCAISWVENRPDKRFSIYIQQHFKGLVDLPQTKLVHYNNIKDSNFCIESLKN